MVLGWILAMTETYYVHLIDPDTLETVHSLDITDSPHFPEGLGKDKILI